MMLLRLLWKEVSSVTGQTGESQKTDVSKKQSTPNFPKNEYFVLPDTHTYVCVSGDKKCSCFGKFGVLCFLETLVLRFALSPYYRRFHWLVQPRNLGELESGKELNDIDIKPILNIIKASLFVHSSKLYWNKNYVKFLCPYFFVVPQIVAFIKPFEVP